MTGVHDVTATAKSDNDIMIELIGKAFEAYSNPGLTVTWQQWFNAYKNTRTNTGNIIWTVTYHCDGHRKTVTRSCEVTCK